MDAGEIRARITLQTSEFNSRIRDVRGQMEATSRSAQRVSKDIKGIHNAALALGGAMAVGLGAAVTTAANFEQKLADVKSVSGATSEEMTKLGDLAKDMGMKTAFSATEAAAGIEELIKAGLSVEQVINGGLEASLNLAIAGNLQLAEAAEISSTALNSFKSDGLSAADAANILAGSANASATDVQEMKFGLSMVSAVASGVGLTFRDTATSLALFAQNGLKGSDAGTSLKTMLLNLSPSTEAASEQMGKLGLLTEKGTSAFYDANGSIRSMAEIAELLQTKLANLSDEQRQMALKTMFGTDAIRAANILYKEGALGIDAMWTAMSKVTALDVATVKIDTLKGAFNEFTSSLESVGIEIGEEFLPGLTDLTRFVTDLVRKFGEVDGSAIKVGLAMAGAATGVALVGTSIAKLSVALRAFALTPVGAAITALSILGGVIAGAVVQQNEMSKVTLENAEAMIDSQAALEDNIKQYDQLKLKSKLTSDELARFVDINSLITKTADPNIIAALRDEQAKLQEKSGLSNDELQRMVDLNGKIIETVPNANVAITDQGNALLNNTDAAKKYNKEQLEMLRLELEHQKNKADANMNKNLVEEKRLLEEINDLNTKRKDKAKEIEDQEKLVREATAEVNKAKAEGNQAMVTYWENELILAEQELQISKDQNFELSGKLQKKQESLVKVQEEIGKLDEVKRKMIDIEMKQAGLNAKRGEEVRTIELGLAKLEAQKRKLEETTPVAQRNSGEYRDAVTHIQNQINNLNTVKSRIQEITNSAGSMNSELGKTIRKDVIIRQVAGQSLKQMPGLDYHTGGITGRGQMPMLHTGGLASQFANLPSHNEIDVRLLRNEMVLTEAQQANLMRMIDAGTTKGTSEATTSQTDPNLVRAITDLARRPVTVEIDGREIAQATYEDIDELMGREHDRRSRFNGLR
jgi:TP901 family phage tail tape measure protein